MGQALILLPKTDPFSDVASIDRDGSRMPSCIPIPGIQSRNKRGRKRKVGPLQSRIDFVERLTRISFLTVEAVEAVRGEGRSHEEHNTPL